jgi:hypothetical protein
MSTKTRGYVVALVAAVVLLFGSMAVAVAAANSHTWPWSPAGQSAGAWQQGPGPGGGMMDRDRGWDNGYGGMMGPGPGVSNDSAQISLAEAKKLADDWLVENQPGAAAGPGTQMPMGYVFTVTMDNQTVGALMVNDDTGQVIYRQWYGPTPSASGT